VVEGVARCGCGSGADLVHALRNREINSRELLEDYLNRIDELNRALNAVVTLDVDAARAAATAADEATTRGHDVGVLHGLPITVKDAFETAGLRTTSGAPELAGYVPARDADAVARLRAAGAVVFGKTNLPVFAMDWQSANPVFGVTNNPWDLTRTPGGSSGGAAAAVSAGLTGLELGSDIRGSLRQPAHNCGVFALKPSFGLVPVRGHIPGPPGTLSAPTWPSPVPSAAAPTTSTWPSTCSRARTRRRRRRGGCGCRPRAGGRCATTGSPCGSTTRCARSTAPSSRC
jgi:amidase